ncbi:RNA-directed DNA polymerase from mobile element jockey [Chionoecetes opilio]|uniref:RNA-directed DNA polymerase from mobile element jockey n=1 Tax=Chionoecetes opilio TaxID=41210 RepID=A0A8J5CGW9_CHIOP|nr:RNA-directed DNA polymerase from mobile element jockey [Chionoecetes opilio]
MLPTRNWQDSLDDALDTVVVALDISGALDRVWHGGLLEKLRAKGIQGDLLLLLGNYLQGRTLHVVVNEQASESMSVETSAPKDSVLGPVLWNINVDDLLRQLPVISAYADDCTLSCSYSRQDSERAADEVNQQLSVIQEWGTRWQEAVKVLGVEVDRELRFDGHIKHIAKKASYRVSALRRVASFLDRGGKLLLYKA